MSLCHDLTASSFLKVVNDIKSEIISVSFLQSITLKFFGLSCTLNTLFALDDFVIFTGHFKNIGSQTTQTFHILPYLIL